MLSRLALASLLVLLSACAGPLSVQSPARTSPDRLVDQYQAVDLGAFDRPPGPADGPLYRGLRALTRGDALRAERELAHAADVVPDSLRPFVYDRLVGSATRRFDWTAATDYARQRAEAVGEAFDPDAVQWSLYARYPTPSAQVEGGATTVPFDGYRADGALHGPSGDVGVRFFLDSGSPVTILSRPLADRLGLAVSPVSMGLIAIPARGIEAPVYPTVIDSLRLGAATLYNVPAQVIETDRPVTDGADLFLGFDALSGLLGGVRYGFADSTLTLYARDAVPETDVVTPNVLLEAGYAFLSYRADGRPFTGVVDTGSPFSYVYADWWTPPTGTPGRPVTHRGQLADTEYEFTLDYYDLPATLAGQPVDALPLGLSTRGQVGAPFRVMSLLGTGLFADGALTLDFDRRTASYERR